MGSVVPYPRSGRNVLRHAHDEGTDVATAATGRLTYEQWAARPETTHIEELIDGELVVSPMPRVVHQLAVSALTSIMLQHARDRGDLVLGPAIGIRTGQATVVIPDVVYFLADRVDFDDQQHTVTTSPDLVVEVLSPSNRAHDLVRKRRLFEQHGIREAWFVDTDAHRMEQVVLGADSTYGTPVVHERGHVVASRAVPGLEVAVDEVLVRR